MTSQASLKNFQTSEVTNQPFLRLVLNGVSFPVRHRNRELSCGRTPGFLLAEAQSATHLLECRKECLLALVGAVSQRQGVSEFLVKG